MHSQRGQVLLIMAMMIATVVSVVLTLTFKATTDTQLTKLQEESNKALSAAEAGLEKGLQTQLQAGQVTKFSELINLDLKGIDLEGSTVGLAPFPTSNFETPLVLQDDQYVYYLADYDSVAKTFGSAFNGQLAIYYDSQQVGCSSIALEITILSGSSPNYVLTRYIADGGNKFGNDTNDIYTPFGVGTSDYGCHTTSINIGAITGAKLMFIRTLYAPTKIRINSTSGDLKPQGRYIVSQAKAITGITKKLQLFQSYPQIPAEFFVTSF